MIFIGADHGGFELKEEIKSWLTSQSLAYEDIGANAFIPEDDYPDYAVDVAKKVAKDPNVHVGILVCRSGAGMVIAANKIKHIRAVFVYDERSARHAKEHNNANIISFAADWTTNKVVLESLNTFLHSQFSSLPKRIRRVEKIDAL